MKGTNVLKINQATIREAVKHWLNNTQLTEGAAVSVTKVEPCKNSGYGSADEFDVTIGERDPEPPK